MLHEDGPLHPKPPVAVISVASSAAAEVAQNSAAVAGWDPEGALRCTASPSSTLKPSACPKTAGPHYNTMVSGSYYYLYL